jgi:hypothetical protein
MLLIAQNAARRTLSKSRIVNQNNKDIVVEGELPSPTELRYRDLAVSLHKDNLPYLRDVLYKLSVLSSGLIGGTLFFFKDSNLTCFRGFIAASFILSTITAVIGLVPLAMPTNPTSPSEISANVEKAISFKNGCLRTAVFFIALGFVVALVGIFVGMFSATHY